MIPLSPLTEAQTWKHERLGWSEQMWFRITLHESSSTANIANLGCQTQNDPSVLWLKWHKNVILQTKKLHRISRHTVDSRLVCISFHLLHGYNRTLWLWATSPIYFFVFDSVTPACHNMCFLDAMEILELEKFKAIPYLHTSQTDEADDNTQQVRW